MTWVNETIGKENEEVLEGTKNERKTQTKRKNERKR